MSSIVTDPTGRVRIHPIRANVAAVQELQKTFRHDGAMPSSSPRPSAVRELCVAAIQIACEPGAFEHNTTRASALIRQAAEAGAELVLLPELTPSGYVLTECIWDGAELFHGPTTTWLAGLAVELGLYLGTTFLEADGEDFFNTFVLVNPRGEIAGRVRKNPPASFEAWFYRAGSDPHWFDTPIGRIGVGICFENALYERYLELHNADVDLLLRPFSGASFQARFPIRQRDVDTVNAALRDGTGETARLTGRPVVMANKVGRLVSRLPAGFPPQDIEFPGYSAVADGDGRVLGQLGPGAEGVVGGRVRLDPNRKVREAVPRKHGRWTAQMPWWAFVWTLTQRMGERAYAQSAQRRARARSVSTATWTPDHNGRS